MIFISKSMMCKMLKIPKPTIDSLVANDYYKKHYVVSKSGLAEKVIKRIEDVRLQIVNVNNL